MFRHHAGLPGDCRQAVVAVGNFDGVHLGHQGVIREAGRIAEANGVPWGVMTFEPHPRKFFKPDQPSFRITPLRAKSRAVAVLNVDFLLTLRFDHELATMGAEEFVQKVLIDNLNVFHVVCGYDFSFGKGAKGNCELLLQMGMVAGFGMTAVGAIEDSSGEVYSSTRVRNYLTNSDPKAAARLLNRPFEITGRVRHGDERGRTIGFPTANVHLGDCIEPTRGVYAVRVAIDQGTDPVWHGGVANIGVRPTFDKTESVLEVFLFDFDRNLYGTHVRVQLIDFIRPEMKFSGVEDLKSQIASDCTAARNLLK